MRRQVIGWVNHYLRWAAILVERRYSNLCSSQESRQTQASTLTTSLYKPASNAWQYKCIIYFGAYLKYFKIQTHVQTARESPDLNIDFRPFDNGFKQLYK